MEGTYFILMFFFFRDLKLKTPFYQKTCVYGHFGRPEFPWESPKTLKFQKGDAFMKFSIKEREFVFIIF